MNSRQAAKMAAERIEELEYYQREATLDIKAYNACILSMIKGGPPCEWCEDQIECQEEAKTTGKGCDEWLLAFREKVEVQEQEQETPIAIDSVGGDGSEG